jgi:UDP-glucose 4-epimerase
MPDSPRTVPELTDRTVLVTGGAGFIGTHLVTALADANSVRLLDTSSTGRSANLPADVTAVQGDIRDQRTLADVMAGVDVVFHLAAQVSVPDSIDYPRATHDTNLSGTVCVLEQARKNDSRVVFASSAAVYGEPDEIPVDESAPKRPMSPYGISKCGADQYTRRYADLYGLPTVALRYFNVYGPSTHTTGGVVSAFVDRARGGDPLLVHGDGEQTRDFVHVSDVVQANILAAQTEAVGRAYNVGTGTRVSINRLATLVKQLAPTDPRIEHTEGRTDDITHSCADISRAVDRLGYDPAVSLQDGLSAMFETGEDSESFRPVEHT